MSVYSENTCSLWSFVCVSVNNDVDQTNLTTLVGANTIFHYFSQTNITFIINHSDNKYKNTVKNKFTIPAWPRIFKGFIFFKRNHILEIKLVNVNFNSKLLGSLYGITFVPIIFKHLFNLFRFNWRHIIVVDKNENYKIRLRN